MEENQKIIDEMESLWFFSSILSPSPSPPAQVVASTTTTATVAQDGDQEEKTADQFHHLVEETNSTRSANQEKAIPSIPEAEQISSSSSTESKVGSSSDFDFDSGSSDEQQLQRRKRAPVPVKEQELNRRSRNIQVPGTSIRRKVDSHQVETIPELGKSTGSGFDSEPDLQQQKKIKKRSTSPVIRVKEANTEEEWGRRNRWLVTDIRDWNYLEPQGFEVIQGLRDLGFDFGSTRVPPITRSRNSSRNPYLVRKMPSLNDGMAMKKHLKLWAQAVACTVK